MSKSPQDEPRGVNDPDAAQTGPQNEPARRPKPPKMPFTAFFGALAFPGLGQVLVGRVRRGIGWCCLAWGLSVAALASFGLRLPVAVGAGLFAAYGIGRLLEFIDAIRCGLRPRWRFGNRFTRALLIVVLAFVSYWVSQGFAMVWRGPLDRSLRRGGKLHDADDRRRDGRRRLPHVQTPHACRAQ